MYRGGTFLSIGDSITWNSIYGTTAPVLNDNKHYNFLTADWIRDNKGNIQFINKGSGGATSTTTWNNRNFWGNIRADLATICLGMNDSAAAQVSTATYETNLTNIIGRLRTVNPNVRIVICTPPPTIDPNRSTIGDYATVCVNLATSLNTTASPVTVCRFDQAWATDNAGLKSSMPYFNIQSITATSSLMTVNATAHGLITGSQISIRGSAQSTYNVTYSGATSTPVVTRINNDQFTIAGSGFSTAGDSTAGMAGFSDNVHPTTTGHVLLSNALTAVIGSDAWYSQLGVIS
jgi:lysophospholipase L1-like esterase